jgi:hypothetical protein
MNEHPILFSTPMVTAILDARKIQTRRVVDKLYPISNPNGNWVYVGEENGGYVFKDSISSTIPLKCPYGQVGDRLWVKESALYPPDITEQMIIEGADTWPKVVYSEGNVNINELKDWGWKQKPSIFMPRWASRITLEITDIRVQKLHEIGQLTHDDCAKEGWPFGYNPDFLQEHPLATFRRYWDSINEKRGYGWDKNPWVWVISFKVLEVNK